MEPSKTTKKVIILSCEQMIGDEVNLETMDYSTKTLREPTMSLIIPKLQKMGHVAIVVNWLKIKEEFVAENTASN